MNVDIYAHVDRAHVSMADTSELVEPSGDEFCVYDDEDGIVLDFDPTEADEHETGQRTYTSCMEEREIAAARSKSAYFEPVCLFETNDAKKMTRRVPLSALLERLRASNASVYEETRRALKLFTTSKDSDGVRRNEDFVEKVGGLQNLLDLLERCPVWSKGFVEILEGESIENVMDRMAADDAVRWGTRGIPLTKAEAKRFAAADNGNKIARSAVKVRRETKQENLGSPRKQLMGLAAGLRRLSSGGAEAEALQIVDRLSATIARDSRVVGLTYVWDCQVKNGRRKRYVGESVGLKRPLQHVKLIEEAHRVKDSMSTQQYAHATVSDDVQDQIRGLPDGTAAERYARRKALLDKSIVRVMSAGVLLKDSSRRALEVFFTLADEKSRASGTAFVTAEDAVRVFGLIKWLRETFETIAFRTGAWESTMGLNKSSPGVPYRWMFQIDPFVKTATVEQMRELLKTLSAHDLVELGICGRVDELAGDALSAAFTHVYMQKTSRKKSVIINMLAGVEDENVKRQRREILNSCDFATIDDMYKKFHKDRVDDTRAMLEARLPEGGAAARDAGKSRKRSRQERRAQDKFSELRIA